MRSLPALLFLLILTAGCATGDFRSTPSGASITHRAGGGGGGAETVGEAIRSEGEPTTSSEAARAATAISERRIIRDANLTLVLDDPAGAARRIASLAEQSGGFVTSNESRRAATSDETPGALAATIILRVPAEQFDSVLDRIRGFGKRVVAEKITGQDVTEEYLDLEARLRAKQALEAQFLEIMKTARTVADALAVQTQLGEVRGEIEQLEGRRRFLENRTSLSTITVTLEPPAPLFATRPDGFLSQLAGAFGGGLDAAATVLLLMIRAVLALLPVALLILLPAVLVWRHLRRRAARRDLAARLEAESIGHK